MNFSDDRLNLPMISDKVLVERQNRVTPLILADGALNSFKPVHPRNASFLWSPTDLLPVEGFVEHSRSLTHHSCGYYAFFKPSIAEVLAQLPDDEEIVGFYIDTGVEVEILYDGDGHRAMTVWLKKEVK